MKKEFGFGFGNLDGNQDLMDELEKKYKVDEWGDEDFDENVFDCTWWVGMGDDCMNCLVVGEKIQQDKEMMMRIEGVSADSLGY